MKTDILIRIGLAAAAAVAVAGAPAAEAEAAGEVDKAVTAEAGVDVMSCYMWRGRILCDVPVWQPSATLGVDLGDWGRLSANTWASFRLTSRRDGTPVSGMGNHEIDYTLSYAKSFGDVDVEVGHIWYTFPAVRNAGNTEELYASAAYNNVFVTPSVAVYWDYRDNDEDGLFYGTFSLAREFELMTDLKLTPSVTIGVGSDSYMRASVEGVGHTAFLDQTTGLFLGYQVTEWMSIGAQVNYTWIVDRPSRRAGYMGHGARQRVWGGVGVSFTF